MSIKKIYLIRHAEPDYPGGEAMYLGQKVDLPLSAAGFAQAESLARLLSCQPIEAVYTSPLLRARQTAQAIAAETCPLREVPDLLELSGGEWDGLTFAKVRSLYPDKRACPPGGECDEQGLARALIGFKRILSQTEHCAAVVAHGGINRLLLSHYTGSPLSESKQYRMPHAGCCLLLFEHDAFSRFYPVSCTQSPSENRHTDANSADKAQ